MQAWILFLKKSISQKDIIHILFLGTLTHFLQQYNIVHV